MRRLILLLLVLALALLPTGLRAESPDVSAFAAQTWYHHGAVLTVDQRGLITIAGTPGTPWATVPPTHALITSVVGATAYAFGLEDGQPLWLVLLPYGMLIRETPLDQIGSVFCGDVTGDPYPDPSPWGTIGPCGI